MDKLTEIQEALKAATPGPWEVVDLGSINIAKGYHKDGDKHIAHWIAEMDIQDYDEEDQVYADAHLIAHAPEYITYLLKLVEDQAKEIAEKDKALSFYADEEKYKQEYIETGEGVFEGYWEAPEILEDGGKIARKARGESR